MSDVISC